MVSWCVSGYPLLITFSIILCTNPRVQAICKQQVADATEFEQHIQLFECKDTL